MGRFVCEVMGLSIKDKSKKDLVHQFLECIGADKKRWRSENYRSEYEDYFGGDWDYLCGMDNAWVNHRDVEKLFEIAYRLFGDTRMCMFYEDDIDNRNAYVIDGKSIDSESEEILCRFGGYDQMDECTLDSGGFADGDIHELLTWDELKDIIEREADNRNIDVSWEESDGIVPNEDDEDFYELCQEVFKQNCDWEKYGIVEETEQFSINDLSSLDFYKDDREKVKAMVSKLLEQAKANGMVELANLLLAEISE